MHIYTYSNQLIIVVIKTKRIYNRNFQFFLEVIFMKTLSTLNNAENQYLLQVDLQDNIDEEMGTVQQQYERIAKILKDQIRQTSNHYQKHASNQYQKNRSNFQGKFQSAISTSVQTPKKVLERTYSLACNIQESELQFQKLNESQNLQNSQKQQKYESLRKIRQPTCLNSNRSIASNKANKQMKKLDRMISGIHEYDQRRINKTKASPFYFQNKTITNEKQTDKKDSQSDKQSRQSIQKVPEYPALQIKQIEERRCQILNIICNNQKNQIQKQRRCNTSGGIIKRRRKVYAVQPSTSIPLQTNIRILGNKSSKLSSNLWPNCKAKHMQQMSKICKQIKNQQNSLNNYIKQFSEFIGPKAQAQAQGVQTQVVVNNKVNRVSDEMRSKSQTVKQPELFKPNNMSQTQSNSIPEQLMCKLNQNNSNSKAVRLGLFRRQINHKLVLSGDCAVMVDGECAVMGVSTRNWWQNGNTARICMKIVKMDQKRLGNKHRYRYTAGDVWGHHKTQQSMLRTVPNPQQIHKYL